MYEYVRNTLKTFFYTAQIVIYQNNYRCFHQLNEPVFVDIFVACLSWILRK